MLQVRGLTVGYDAEPVLEAVDIDVQPGQFVSLVGPSGSGKSSVLKAVTGLLAPLAGTVDLTVDARDVGFLFQDDALLPWRTVRQNVSLGMRIRDVPLEEAESQAEHWLELLHLKGLGDRYPGQLSGGQRKRVALAQVLALAPKLLLMDEPFASLDAIVRTRITEELLDWVEREHLTVLLVTHDLEEAISLSDVVYVLGGGPRATVRGRHVVGIERPRHLLEVRSHPDFAPLLARLWKELEAGMEAGMEGEMEIAK